MGTRAPTDDRGFCWIGTSTSGASKQAGRRRSGGWMALAGALLGLCASAPASWAQPIDMNLGIADDARYQSFKDAFRKSEYVRTDYSLLPNPRVAASATALMVFASNNPLATPDELQAFLSAYDAALASFAGDDDNLIRSNNYLAALRAIDRVEAGTGFRGLDTRVGERVREILGVSVRFPINSTTLGERMADVENARVRTLSYSPALSKVLILGFIGQDLDGNANAGIAPVLEAYLVAEGFEPVPDWIDDDRFTPVNDEIDDEMPVDYDAYTAVLGNVGQDDASIEGSPLRVRLDAGVAQIAQNIGDVYGDIVTSVDPNGDPTTLHEAVDNATDPGFVDAIEEEYRQDILAVSGSRTGVGWATAMLWQSPNPAARQYADAAAELAQISLETSDTMSKAKSGIELATGLATLGVGFAKKDPASVIGGISGSILTGMDLAESFGLIDAPPSIEEQMFEQIVQVRVDIANLGAQLNERFDQIESQLNTVSQNMSSQFFQLGQDIDSINDNITALAVAIAETRSTLNRLEDTLWGWSVALGQADFLLGIDSYLDARSSGSLFVYDEVGDDDFVGATELFENFAVTRAADVLFAGDNPSTLTDPHDARDVLGDDVIGRHVNDLRTFAGTIPGVNPLWPSRVVAAAPWTQGAAAYVQLMRENPWFYAYQFAAGAGEDDTTAIINRGEALSGMMRNARSTTLFNALLNGYQGAVNDIAAEEDSIISVVGSGPYAFINPFIPSITEQPAVAQQVHDNVPIAYNANFEGTPYTLSVQPDNWDVLQGNDAPEVILALVTDAASELGGQAIYNFSWAFDYNSQANRLEVNFTFEINGNIDGQHPDLHPTGMYKWYSLDVMRFPSLEPDSDLYRNNAAGRHARLSLFRDRWFFVADVLANGQNGTPYLIGLGPDGVQRVVVLRGGGGTSVDTYTNLGSSLMADLRQRVWTEASTSQTMLDLTDHLYDWTTLVDAYTTLAAPDLIDENTVVQSGLRAQPGPDSFGIAVDWHAQHLANAADPENALFIWEDVTNNFGMFSDALLSGIAAAQQSTKSGHGYLEWTLAELRDLRDNAMTLAIDDRYLAGGLLEVTDPANGLLANDVRQLKQAVPGEVPEYYGREVSVYDILAWDTPEMDGQIVGDVLVNPDGTFVLTPYETGIHGYRGPAYLSYRVRGSVGDIGGTERFIESDPVMVLVLVEPERPTFVAVPGDCPTIQSAINLIADNPTAVVEVAPGTYRELLDTLGKAFTLRSASGDYRDTIISGDIDNDGTGDGTVIRIVSGEGADTHIRGFTIRDGNNPVTPGGGGMFIEGSGPTVEDCWFTDNRSFRGAAVSNLNANALFRNCLFTRNHTPNFGGGFRDTTSHTVLANCTFAENTSPGRGTSVTSTSGSTTVLVNCIVWGDGVEPLYFGQGTDTTTAWISHSNIEGDFPARATNAGGNISADPMFADQSSENYGLVSGSPSVDAGGNGFVELVGVTTDMLGNARFVDDPDTADTGSGEAPIVDMGAYELQIAPPCRADMNGDMVLDFFDVQTFLNFYAANDLSADFNNDGALDFFDVQTFLGEYSAGCP